MAVAYGLVAVESALIIAMVGVLCIRAFNPRHSRERLDRKYQTSAERAVRIKELIAKYPEPWVIIKEPHDCPDGTKEFTHVRVGYTKRANGENINIEIGSYVTPDLAELLVLLREAAIELSAT